MVQKCSLLKVLQIFFEEPTSIHFIREISRKIKLAPTSVRNHMKELLKDDMIKRKRYKPFDGFIANRENDNFIFYKRVYNLYSLKNITDFLLTSYYPRLIAVYGSYSLGEDIENSDIDVIVISKTKKEVDLEIFEEKLKREIHLLVIESLENIDTKLRKKVWNGIVLYGGF